MTHQDQTFDLASAAAMADGTRATVIDGRTGLNAAARTVAAGLARRPISPVLLTGFARLIEFTMILAAGATAYVWYVAPQSGIDWWYAVPLVAGSLIAVLFIQIAHGYALSAFRAGGFHLGRVFVAWTLTFALLAVIAFFAKIGGYYSRVWFGLWFASGLVMVTAFRLSLTATVRDWTDAGRLQRRAVIVGGGKPAEELIGALDASPHGGVRICGIFDDRRDERSPAVIAGYAKLGTVAELVDFGRLARIDLLIVSLPITAENRLLELLQQLWVLPVDIRLSAHTNRLRFRPRSYSFIGAVPLFDVFDKPIADWDFVAKSVFDRVLGGLILLCALPVMALVALAIRLDSRGPVLFRQKRYGFNNELIEVFKFRSMYVDQTDANASRLVTKDDPRVTGVGRFIRKTSLDELPQLFNVVLKGNLSLVGPRPHAVKAKAEKRLYDEVVNGYFARHRVKPGITGWAQINGWRGETDTEEKIHRRVEHDLFYIENWSVGFDLYILAMTPFALLSTHNAY